MLAQVNPYEGLSDEARETCIRRMIKTLEKRPRSRKTRLYINSLTGKAETAEELRARAKSSAERIIGAAEAAYAGPVIVRARKQRVSPMAPKSQHPHPTKNCRRAIRFQPYFVPDRPRVSRDMTETHRFRAMLVEAQGGICAICGHPMDQSYRASLDHVIPRAMGGKDGLGNYVASHGECNGDKTNDVPTGCEMIWLLFVNAKLGALPVVY